MLNIVPINNNMGIKDIKDFNEPLLQNSDNKYTIFPIKHADIFKHYQLHVAAIWFDAEISLYKDIKDWESMSDNEQFFIKHVLAFFAASDGIIMENISANFGTEMQVAEVRAFYSVQMFMENIHSITYSKIIDTYIKDSEEKLKLFNAIETMPAIKKKARWAEKWITSDASLASRLFAVCMIEGIFFSGAFAAIYFISEKGILPGLSHSNALIARDEGMHCDFAVLLYTKYIVNKLSQSEVDEIVNEAVEIEKEFINESLPCALIGMNAEMMSQYIEYIANRLVSQFGYTTKWANVECPFGFMDKICLQQQNSFFDVKVSEYKVTRAIASEEDNYIDHTSTVSQVTNAMDNTNITNIVKTTDKKNKIDFEAYF